MSKIGDLMRELAIEVDKYFVIEESKQPAEVVIQTQTGMTQPYFKKTFMNATKELREKYQAGEWKKEQIDLDFRGKWRLNDGKIVDIIDSPAIGILRAHNPLNSTDNSINYLLLKTSDLAEKVPEPNIY